MLYFAVDRNEKVKETCKKLIQKWLLYHDNDIIKLLVSLDVEGTLYSNKIPIRKVAHIRNAHALI